MLAALGGVLLVAVGQLRAADIAVTLGGDSAVVDASYEIVHTRRVRFVVPRFVGLAVRVDVTTLAAARQLEGIVELIATAESTTGNSMLVRYVVTGLRDRVPLPVPDVPTEGGPPAVSIVVMGLPPDAQHAAAFPRLRAVDAGTAVALLANVPSVLVLPPRRGRWSTNRVADTAVVVLVVLVTAAWLSRRRGRRRSR